MAKKILIGLGVVLLLIVGIGFTLPATLKVVHVTELKAPVAAVFVQVNDMEKSLAWDPWAANDKTMKVTLGKIKAGVGASKSWVSKESGRGSQTITASIEGKSVESILDFGEQGKAKAWFTLEASGTGTKLTQGFESEPTGNIFLRYFRELMIKGLISKRFAEGHARIGELAGAGG